MAEGAVTGASQLTASETVGPGFALYKPRPSDYLEQGDLIPRSAPVIDTVLRQYHGYHVEKTSNEFFAVLTQSCDLVKHEGRCKARYIALAPVRPLQLILQREFSGMLVNTPGNLFVLGSSETKERYAAFLHRLINNNESRYFFLPSYPQASITEDMCIMLPLALAIRAEHYDECLRGRIAQLEDLFQAKLGWLLGQQYSRVGTPDWDEGALQKKVLDVTDKSLAWYPPEVFEQLKKKVREFEQQKAGEELSEDELVRMQQACTTKIDNAISAVFEVLASNGLVQPGKDPIKFKLRKQLKQTPEFSRHFRDVA